MHNITCSAYVETLDTLKPRASDKSKTGGPITNAGGLSLGPTTPWDDQKGQLITEIH